MQGDQRVLETLNDALTAELTAVNQYFLHAKMLQNWGYERLGAKVYAESIDEMRHADALIERILFLEGHPNLQRLGTIAIGENVPEVFDLDLTLELGAVTRYRDAIRLTLEVGDGATRNLFEKILVESEEHVDWLETQVGLIRELGATAYLAEQLAD